MNITDWNQKPFTSKTFSQPYHPMSYNYIDYMDAWYNMFYLQSYQHSWFIQFSRNCNTQFLAWFKKWWTFFGLLDSIFPPDIQEKFEFYKKNTSSQPFSQPKLLMFCSRLRIQWILTGNIIKKQEQPQPFPLSLSREFNIKWWDKFNHDFVCQQKVLEIISARLGSSNSSQGPTQEEFLTLKSKCQALLAAATDLEQYRQELLQTLKQFEDQKENEENEEIVISDDSYVDPEFIIYGGPMGQAR
ncbi:hypothetical protein PVL29_004607 [Vitis rotundifolia]|uniref:Uncharacterized protein n=1 Tax=Vitis rotundifolia TaxID=103349 RepID=A0AA39A913_VITRO|nr:hypothetical protein PVL29_004607 [Vitis rotundifolia]